MSGRWGLAVLLLLVLGMPSLVLGQKVLYDVRDDPGVDVVMGDVSDDVLQRLDVQRVVVKVVDGGTVVVEIETAGQAISMEELQSFRDQGIPVVMALEILVSVNGEEGSIAVSLLPGIYGPGSQPVFCELKDSMGDTTQIRTVGYSVDGNKYIIECGFQGVSIDLRSDVHGLDLTLGVGGSTVNVIVTDKVTYTFTPTTGGDGGDDVATPPGGDETGGGEGDGDEDDDAGQQPPMDVDVEETVITAVLIMVGLPLLFILILAIIGFLILRRVLRRG